MATSQSPLRGHSYENRPPMDYGLNDSLAKRSAFAERYEKENFAPTMPMPTRYRSRSPIASMPTTADSRFMHDQMRHSQYISRYGGPPGFAPPMHEPIMV